MGFERRSAPPVPSRQGSSFVSANNDLFIFFVGEAAFVLIFANLKGQG